MKLCSAGEMMARDQWAIERIGIPGVVLMENAGRACSRTLLREFADCCPGPVLVVAGKGNNGGDGYVIARVLLDHGWQVETLVLGEADAILGDARTMFDVLRSLTDRVTCVADETALREFFHRSKPTLIIDALFGTGLNSDVRGLQAEAIDLINSSPAPVFAVDIPSGVDGSSGRVCGRAINAMLTVTFDRAKIGHASQPGAAYAGRLEVVDIGIPGAATAPDADSVQLLDQPLGAELLPVRSALGHKGSFGHLLILAGSPGKTGAATLSGNAAVRSGCGLVTLGVPAAVHDIVEVKLTEAMSCPLPDREGCLGIAAYAEIAALLEQRQALAVGPGLGQSEELLELFGRILETVQVPVVIDADGLNLLARRMEWLKAPRPQPLILTPHPGEMARLSGLSVTAIQAERFRVAREFAAEHQVVLVLKGAATVIAAPDGRVLINSTGNDGLASGGSGDVLTGLIGGLLAQGLDPFAAAGLGVWLQGRAAEQAAAELGTAGLAAGDLLIRLPSARRELAKGA